jgi:uncharacterized protein YgbK (DUF1537 family)
MSVVLGCIADDLTGGSDLALMLARNGLRTIQTIGVPSGVLPEADAVVIALKSRTAPPDVAISDSLAALRWLERAGARQYFFKYCSTFDSTPTGNIGPVADAFLDALGADFTIVCPAFPTNSRTLYRGHLFVGDVLLSESGMRNHPLTPMTESNLLSVLARQTRHKVGLISYETVEAGSNAIEHACHELRRSGVRYAVVDALRDDHLVSIGEAALSLKLVTGGSGIAMSLPGNFRRQGLVSEQEPMKPLPGCSGYSAVLAGSCSQATLAQISAFEALYPSFRIDPLQLAAGENVVAAALAWAGRLRHAPVLIYASATPDCVARAQSHLGRDRAGKLVENALSEIADGLVAAGIRRLVVAGGETSGAVVNRLGIRALRIGPEIDPGVPWTASVETPTLLLALKSGNFGSRDFFIKAFNALS